MVLRSAFLAAALLAAGASPAAPLDEARALGARAAEQQALGFRQRAIADLEEALDLIKQEKRAEARALAAALRGALGQALLRAGQDERARIELEAALAAAREQRLTAVAAAALNDLGRVHASAGRAPEAQKAWGESAALAREAGASLVFAAAASNSALPALLTEAEALLARANSREADFARMRLAEAWGKGSLRQQHGLLRAAFDSAEARDDALAFSWAAGHLGELYAGAGRDAEALGLMRRAVFAAQAARADESLYRWSWSAARLMAKTGEREQAIAAYRRAQSSLQVVRADLILELRAARRSWRETVGPLYLELADQLLRRAPGESVPQARLVEARNVVEQLKAIELEDYFQDDCVAGQLARQKDIDAIEPRTAVVYPIVLPDRIEMLVGMAGGIRQVTLPLGAAALTEQAHGFRRMLEKRTTNQFMPFARRLYTALFQPIEAELTAAGIETVVFIPDGPLRGVPVAALNDGQRFLIERYAFATAPGLTLIEPQALAANKAAIQVMLSGLTESVQNFPALPFVAEELEDIEKIFPGRGKLLDRDFVVAGFEKTLRSRPYSIVHIASHGEFDSDPKKSFLLAWDGRLSMDNLEQVMKLARFRDDPIELLTLSACRTAAGDDRAALGIAGVAVKAGARSALATLWYVNDQASSLLVADFYRGLREGASKAKALQAAQRAVIGDARFRHPGYWAPFLLVGNWL